MNRLPKCKCESCPNYKKTFIPLNGNSFQKYCLKSEQCRKEFVSWANKPKQKKKVSRIIKKQDMDDFLDKHEKLSYYEKKLEDEINHICRLIDKGCKCISCNAKGNSAGHFHSVAANKTIRYNLHNLHLQEYSCNGNKGGNVIAYGRGLIETYGKEYKEYVEYDLVRLFPYIKWMKEDLKEWTIKARQIVKELKKLDLEYSPHNRILLRRKYNHRIGIYL